MGLMDYPVLIIQRLGHLERRRIRVVETLRDIPCYFNVLSLVKPHGNGIRLIKKYIRRSKSAENPNGAVFLSDDRDTVIRKFKRAVTDF